MRFQDEINFESLVGKTLEDVKTTEEDVRFFVEDGEEYMLYHSQDCCEAVYLEDVVGDIKDLVGSPVLLAEEVHSFEDPPSPYYEKESFTWTFYKVSTIKGSVTFRFFGTSNGYYSEAVSFVRVC